MITRGRAVVKEYQPIALLGCADAAAVESLEPTDTVVDWATGEVLQVHPFAARFPMLGPEDLADLAEDIRVNGLVDAVILDQARVLIDGRNRMAACADAKVAPHYRTLPPGVDATDYILSLNVLRRHMSAGQRAMAVALRGQISGSAKSRRGLQSQLATESGLNQKRISEALLVLEYASDLSDSVLAGDTALDKAYRDAQERRDAAIERKRQLERLVQGAPELALLVQEQGLPLADAIAALDKREQEERTAEAEAERRAREERQAAVELIVHAISGIGPAGVPAEDWASQVGAALGPEPPPTALDISPPRLRQAAAGLAALAEVLEEQANGAAEA